MRVWNRPRPRRPVHRPPLYLRAMPMPKTVVQRMRRPLLRLAERRRAMVALVMRILAISLHFAPKVAGL